MEGTTGLRCVLRFTLVIGLLGFSWAQTSNFCELPCVIDLYAQNCGGATCVFGTNDPREPGGLCSLKCRRALFGDPFRACLLDSDFVNAGDPSTIQSDLTRLVSTHCFSFGVPPIDPEALTPEAAPSPETPVLIPSPPAPAPGSVDSPEPTESPLDVIAPEVVEPVISPESDEIAPAAGPGAQIDDVGEALDVSVSSDNDNIADLDEN